MQPSRSGQLIQRLKSRMRSAIDETDRPIDSVDLREYDNDDEYITIELPDIPENPEIPAE